MAENEEELKSLFFFFDGFALVFVTVSYKKKKERRIVTMRNGGLDWEWGRRRLGPGQELGGSEPSRAILDLLKP